MNAPDPAPKPDESATSPWVEEYFGGFYRSLYTDLVDSDEELSNSVDWIVNTLAWGKDDPVLDLACGYGRHLVRLAKCPGRFFGIDIVASQIIEAKHLLADAASLVQGDMFRLPYAEGSFAIVLQLFNSFGYRPLGADDSLRRERQLLGEIRRVLKPGGRALLELPSIEHVRVALDEGPTMFLEQGTRRVRENWKLDMETRLLHGTTTFELERDSQTVDFCVRMFTLTEFNDLALEAGLRPSGVHGDLTGSPFKGAGSQQMVITLEKIK